MVERESEVVPISADLNSKHTDPYPKPWAVNKGFTMWYTRSDDEEDIDAVNLCAPRLCYLFPTTTHPQCFPFEIF